MTYLGFLIGFVLLPIILLLAWHWYESKNTDRVVKISRNIRLGYAFLLLSSLALAYTTLWDNYLVATNVWWYDPNRVLGITIGWVPLEEYLFFILQPVLGGLLLLFFWNRWFRAEEDQPAQQGVRRIALAITSLIWLGALAVLVIGYQQATYLGLELIWAVPIIILQLAFGADILWKNRQLLVMLILGLTIYLSLADAIAIQSGVWTIDPQQSLGILLGGVLPLEEFVFFLLTNTMVGFGFVLIWSPESHTRLGAIKNKLKSNKQIGDVSRET